MTRPKITEDITVLAANIETRKASQSLLNLIHKHDPDVVIVEQAYRARRWLRRIKGYQHRQYWGPEASGIAVLVRDGIRINRRRKLRMKRTWVGPKAGRFHQPRVYPALVLIKGAVTFRVLGIHLPTRNQPVAQDESLRRIVKYFREHPNSPIIAAGDWNRKANELEATARACDAELLHVGKVDHAIVRGITRPEHGRLPTPAGAHGWALYTVTATEENQ